MRAIYWSLIFAAIFNPLFFMVHAPWTTYLLFNGFDLIFFIGYLKQEKQGEKLDYSGRTVLVQMLVSLPFIFLITGAIGFAYIGAILINAVLLLWLHLRHRSMKRPKDNLERLRFDTGTDWTELKIKEVSPSSKSIMGGFVIPFLPIFVRIKSKPHLKYEAIIHEHMHIAWFVYGGQLAILYTALLFLWWFDASTIVFVLTVFAWMILQEYLAFTSTRKYAHDNKWPETRPFDKVVVMKYLAVYGSYAFIMSFAIAQVTKVVGQSLVGVGISLLIAIGVSMVLSWIWYPIFAKMGWISDGGIK